MYARMPYKEVFNTLFYVLDFSTQKIGPIPNFGRFWRLLKSPPLVVGKEHGYHGEGKAHSVQKRQTQPDNWFYQVNYNGMMTTII